MKVIIVSLLLLSCLSLALGADKSSQTYTPPEAANSLFFETFNGDWEDRWTLSGNEKFKDGEWKVGTGPQGASLPGEVGLLVKGAAKHHAISAPFVKKLNSAKTDIVIQYEVRFHQAHSCGGAYIKLLSEDKDFTPKTFHDKTQYTIMFGPDKCGSNDKVHFIFRHKNPVSGEVVEHHMKSPPVIRNDRRTHLYTLVLKRDNTFEMLIDNELKRSGSTLTEFDPPVNPPPTIDDPSVSKPTDWVDKQQIQDPEVSKPDDWDEDAPKRIPDPTAVKPRTWLDDAPAQIPDPSAVKPEDWDDEEDGEWEAPFIDNPECKRVGCGEWKAPMVDNPNYKGKWVHPMIDNPEYVGPWVPPQVPNPDFFEETDPAGKLTPMVAMGIELWTMQDDIEFDNFYIGVDAADAREWATQTWGKKHAAEVAADEAKKPVLTSMVEKINKTFQEYPILFVVIIILVLGGSLYACVACCGLSDDESHGHSHSGGHGHQHAPRSQRKTEDLTANDLDLPAGDDSESVVEEQPDTGAGLDAELRQRHPDTKANDVSESKASTSPSKKKKKTKKDE